MQTIFWRKDGKPIWKDLSLLCGMDQHLDLNESDAEKFLQRLSLNLGISEKNIIPAYEDPIAALLQESMLPVDVNPLEAKLEDSLERRQLADSLSRGLKTLV